MSPAKLLFEPYGIRIDAEPGETVLEAARASGIGIRSECGGAQTCGKCKIISREGLSEVTKGERRVLTKQQLAEGYRLACAAKVLPGFERITIAVPTESVLRERRFMEPGLGRQVRAAPAIEKVLMELPPPTMSDRKSDEERLLGTLEAHGLHRVEIEAQGLRELSKLLPKQKKLTAVMWGRSRVISVEAGDTRSRLFGLAVDVGTSKITCSLFDLTKGQRVGFRSVENPQITYGEDVVSRISFAQAGEDNWAWLQRTVIEGINGLVGELCAEVQIFRNDIHEAVVVGNTVMHHMLLGLDTHHLGRSPFVPAVRRAVSVRARDLGLAIAEGGMVYSLPNIDAFVGADAVGDILSSRLHLLKGPALMLDVGTNTEVMLRGSDGGIISCSCASGPAFEGVHIEHGMKAVEGAIDQVKLLDGGDKVRYTVVGGGKPVGLCGSAIIDVVAEMLRSGVIDGVGRFTGAGEDRLRPIGGARKYVLVESAESGTGKEVTVSERDVNEVLLAKAAIYTGCSILMKEKRVQAGDLRRVLIAGAFGSHINKTSARVIGLIPDVEASKISFIGNSALAGAEIALMSISQRAFAEKVAREVHYHELAIDPRFETEFASALRLPHRRAELFPTAQRLIRRR